MNYLQVNYKPDEGAYNVTGMIESAGSRTLTVKALCSHALFCKVNFESGFFGVEVRMEDNPGGLADSATDRYWGDEWDEFLRHHPEHFPARQATFFPTGLVELALLNGDIHRVDRDKPLSLRPFTWESPILPVDLTEKPIVGGEFACIDLGECKRPYMREYYWRIGKHVLRAYWDIYSHQMAFFPMTIARAKEIFELRARDDQWETRLMKEGWDAGGPDIELPVFTSLGPVFSFTMLKGLYSEYYVGMAEFPGEYIVAQCYGHQIRAISHKMVPLCMLKKLREEREELGMIFWAQETTRRQITAK